MNCLVIKIRSVHGLNGELLVMKVVTFWATLDVTEISTEIAGHVIR